MTKTKLQVAIPTVACVGSVLKCQQSPKEEKAKWMFRHKSKLRYVYKRTNKETVILFVVVVVVVVAGCIGMRLVTLLKRKRH